MQKAYSEPPATQSEAIRLRIPEPAGAEWPAADREALTARVLHKCLQELGRRRCRACRARCPHPRGERVEGVLSAVTARHWPGIPRTKFEALERRLRRYVARFEDVTPRFRKRQAARGTAGGHASGAARRRRSKGRDIRIHVLRRQGLSIREIAARVGCGKSSVSRALAREIRVSREANTSSTGGVQGGVLIGTTAAKRRARNAIQAAEMKWTSSLAKLTTRRRRRRGRGRVAGSSRTPATCSAQSVFRARRRFEAPAAPRS